MAIALLLPPKPHPKQLTFAIASAGISGKLNTTLLKNINMTDTAGFSDKLIKGVVDGTSQGLLESAVYGTDLTEALEKNLRAQIVQAGTSEIFTHIVKPVDADTLSRNIAHKLAAALTGCVSAAANKQDCEAGAIGAAVGEMWGDYQVDDPNTLSQEQKDALINQAKLLAGIAAAFAGEDVNVAAGVAGEAVRWNAIYINKGSIPENQRAECKQLGISASDCGRYHGEKKLKILKEIGLLIVPTTPEEIALAVVTGGAGGYVIKVGGKVISKVFKSKDGAQKALDKAQELAKLDAKTKAEVEPDNDLFSNKPSGRREYYNFNLMSKQESEKIASEIKKRSPIQAPTDATQKIEQKAAGYAQIKYTWVKNGVKYESRWHTRTPGAPANQTNSWVVTRKKMGSKTQKGGETEYLLNDGRWIAESKWNNALKLRKQGRETKESREILDRGHIKDVE